MLQQQRWPSLHSAFHLLPAQSLSPSNYAAARDTPTSLPPWLLQGAIYVTDNAGYSWTAAVKETVDATLNRTVSSGISGASYYEGTFANISRSKAGDYVAVSSRGLCRVNPTGQPLLLPSCNHVLAAWHQPFSCFILHIVQRPDMQGTT